MMASSRDGPWRSLYHPWIQTLDNIEDGSLDPRTRLRPWSYLFRGLQVLFAIAAALLMMWAQYIWPFGPWHIYPFGPNGHPSPEMFQPAFFTYPGWGPWGGLYMTYTAAGSVILSGVWALLVCPFLRVCMMHYYLGWLVDIYATVAAPIVAIVITLLGLKVPISDMGEGDYESALLDYASDAAVVDAVHAIVSKTSRLATASVAMNIISLFFGLVAAWLLFLSLKTRRERYGLVDDLVAARLELEKEPEKLQEVCDRVGLMRCRCYICDGINDKYCVIGKARIEIAAKLLVMKMTSGNDQPDHVWIGGRSY